MNEFHSSQNNGAKQSVKPSQWTHNWFILSKHVKKFLFLGRSCKKTSRNLRIFLEEKAKKVRGSEIGPKWMAFPSKTRIYCYLKTISFEDNNRSKIATAESFKIYFQCPSRLA